MIEQRTPEWINLRLGLPTGSRVYDILPGARGGYKKARETCMYELLTERITGVPVEHYVTPAMEWGTMYEAEAIDAFVDVSGIAVTECGFIRHSTIRNFGASPDGLWEKGVIEVKCPTSPTHIKILATKEIKPQWLYQIQAEMMVANAKHAWFISYDPRLPEVNQLYVDRVYRDDDMVDEITEAVNKFNEELDELEGKVNEHSF